MSFLLTTGTITFIEALRTDNLKIRHIMNIETAISIIAGYFYGTFLHLIKENKIDYKKMNNMRYTDWFITTPFMILGLELVLSYNNNTSLPFKHFLISVILNFGMLIFGYLCDIDIINKKQAMIGGFILFGLLFYYIYYIFVKDKKSFQNLLIFLIFLIFWSIYGIVYLADDKIKNITYNILDVFAKCIVGIGFWAYLTKLFN